MVIDKCPILPRQFADLAHCGRSTVLAMIRRGTIPARPVNPQARRLTYRIPTWALRQLLNLDPPEPEYQSRLLAGRL